jgi:type II secretion system protein J
MMKRLALGGFTLAEFLIAFTIFAVVASGIYTAWGVGLKAWSRSEEALAEIRTARLFLERLSRQLQNAQYFSGFGLKGGPQEINFIYLDYAGPGSAPQDKRLMRVFYRLAQGKISSALLKGGDVFLDKPEPVYKDILKSVADFSLQYSYKKKESASGEVLWLERWDKESLPMGVKMQLTLSSPRRQES